MKLGEIKFQNGWWSGEDQMKLADRCSGAFVLANVTNSF